MRNILPYGLSRIWAHPHNRDLEDRLILRQCLRRSATWATYQLEKHLGRFPNEGRSLAWVDDLRLYLRADSQSSQACLYYGLGDWPSMQFLRQYLRKGDLCADIGANVGIYTLLMAQHAGPASVLAFECLPSNIEKLRANLALNHFDGPGGVTVHPVALADITGPVKINLNDGDSTTSISPFLLREELGTPSGTPITSPQEVFARQLDEFSSIEPFSYIKMDVEGAEMLVLKGAKEILERSPPRVWSIEVLDTGTRLGFSPSDLLREYARWGYQFYVYRPAQNRLVSFDESVKAKNDPRRDDNVLAIHEDALDHVARRLCGVGGNEARVGGAF